MSLHRLRGSFKKNNKLDSFATGALCQMLEDLPVAVMVCDPREFRITYMNQASRQALASIEHVLPVAAADVEGQCIDIFHKHPAHQRQLLADPGNLPHQARFTVGDEWLELQASAIRDESGAYLGPMVVWKIVTAEVRQQQESEKLLRMLDQMPINVMLANKETLELEYLNRTSIETLHSLQHLLPVSVDKLKGQCIDIFHKHPAHQRQLLADPSRLPHKAVIQLGEEHLSLDVAAINDLDGNYLAPMVTWSVVTANVQIANEVSNVAENVSAASAEMTASAESMASMAEQSNTVAATVASSSEELSSSISEISRQVATSTAIAETAIAEAKDASERINSLAQTAQRIETVVSLIQDIASQTNLLALNATIEAARAGDAGKGFAVVANEVKGLASQTAKATEDISRQVLEIQTATEAAVHGTESVARTIDQMGEIATAIASAVEQQSAATQEVSANITQVSSSANETGAVAQNVLDASSELSRQAEKLRSGIEQFLQSCGAAGTAHKT